MQELSEDPVNLSEEDHLHRIVDRLIAALINTRIHHAEHPRVSESNRQTLDAVDAFLGEFERESLTLSVTDEFLVFEGRPLVDASCKAPRLIQALTRLDSGGLEIDAGTSADDLGTLLRVINQRPDGSRCHDDANAELERSGCQGVRLLDSFNVSKRGLEPGDYQAEIPVHVYQSLMELLENVTVSISSGGRIDFDMVRRNAEAMLLQLEEQRGELVDLARNDQYDAFGFGHSLRVSALCLNFGRSLTSDRDLLIRLGTAALLHDVGNARIPPEILQSERPLTPEEQREVSKHPEYGAEILLDHTDCDPESVAACFGHHRRQEFRGYPNTVHEHQTSVITQVVGIADVFEALTAARPYKRPMTPIRAYRVMMSMKHGFDPGLLRSFIDATGVFPAGQVVELSTGALARVERQSSDVRLPVVRLITDPDKNSLLPTERTLWNLEDRGDQARVDVLRVSDAREALPGDGEVSVVGPQAGSPGRAH